MWGRSLWLALIAGLGAAVAWGISQPFLPNVPISETSIESTFSLGTFYGWFHNLLFGILVCGPLSFLIVEPRSKPATALLCGLLGGAIGGAFVCGTDALSDFMNIRLQKSGFPHELLALDWNVLVAAAMAFAIALACQPTPKRLTRTLIAAAIGGAGSFVLRLIMTPIAAIVFLTKSMSMTPAELAKTNSWALYSPSELIQNVSMAIVMGLVLGFVEYFGREAWLRLEVGRNEGRDHTLDRPVTRIGSAEGADISLREDPAVFPFHAQIAEQQGMYYLSSLGGSVTVNGFPVQSALLQVGDMIHLGGSALRFIQKGNRGPVIAPAAGPVVMPEASRLQPPPITTQAPVPSAYLEWAGGLKQPLANGINVLGRDPDSVINLSTDQAVSRRHAAIEVGPEGTVLRDTDSRNGTLVNGSPLVGQHVLANGDVIQVGSTKMTYRCATHVERS